ncbi:hypothetical protein [Treponema pedis]|uniref:hypothetical protein n=1 Tax=Treponema pedis TaxID=409322 RepID=UPI0003FA0BCF|nr:hypothetical protein [Treponema pedis]
MAIHPIDLQTLYSQMDKIGRQQGAEQQVAAAAKNVQQQQNKLDAEKKLSSVQVINPGDNEGVKINGDGHFKKDEKNKNKPENEHTEKKEELSDNYIKDPYLGQHVDISG